MKAGCVAGSMLLALVAGCWAGDAPGRPHSQHPPEPSVSPRPAGSTSEPGAPSLARARVVEAGDGLQILARLEPRLPSGDTWDLVAVTPDEQLLVSLDEEAGTDRAALLDPLTGDVTYLAPSRQGGVFDADADQRWVVWVETTSSDLFTLPWRMYSHDRRTHRTRLIAEAPDVGVDPVPAAPDGTRPRLRDGRVYFAAVAAVDGHRVQDVVPAVYTVPVDGSAPMRQLIRGAFDPQVSGEEMVYTVGTGGSFATWDMRLRHLGTGADVSVRSARRGPRHNGYAFGGGVLAWQVSAGGPYNDRTCTSYLRSGDGTVDAWIQGRCAHAFASHREATATYQTFAVSRRDRYVAYVYDLRTDELFRLTDEHVIEAPNGHGDLLVWRPDGGPDRGRVVVARLTGPE